MKIPDFLKSTQEMLFHAFPDGIDEESYWVLLYLLYDHMCDENLALVMSSVTAKPMEIIANDIYGACHLMLDEKEVQEIKCILDMHGFEKWKKKSETR